MAAFPQLRTPTPEDPLRILMSACLGGIACGYDGTNNGEYPVARQVLQYPTAKVVRFCPEEFSFGTPRSLCDIHGGNGFALEYRASRLLCDARILSIFEGAAEIQAQVIARRLMDRRN